MRIAATLFLLPTILCAEPALKTSPAVTLSYKTEAGKFYQIQTKTGAEWKDLGHAIAGTGEPVTITQPPGDYRVVTPENKWVLVWSDEFDGDTLDTTKWAREENNYGGGNNERQAYRTDPKFCHVKGGHLNIALHHEPHTTSDGKTQPYSSARIRSMRRGDWTFGRFEFRAKVPAGEGVWPAIWMLPTDSKYGGWASGGEIDILESRGSQVDETTSALHFGGPWPRNTHLAQSYKFPGKNAAEDFHVYALEWSKDEISWFVDGVKWKTRKSAEWFSEAAKDNPSAPYDQPFHLIINLAVDGRFFEQTKQRSDKIPASDFPQVFQVDYARVYQWSAADRKQR